VEPLPVQATKYVRRIEELSRCPVALVSTSPERDDTILCAIRSPPNAPAKVGAQTTPIGHASGVGAARSDGECRSHRAQRPGRRHGSNTASLASDLKFNLIFYLGFAELHIIDVRARRSLP